MSELIPPEACKTMAELRVQIDAIDVELITLLANRTGYIDRAVGLKKIEGLPARTTDRVAEVLDKVGKTASRKRLDPELVRKLWGELIEWSIQREIKELGA
jgi:isochorismate pyruvate lyase